MKLRAIVTAICMAGAFGAGAATVTQNGTLFELVDASTSSKATIVKKVKAKKVKYSTYNDKSTQREYFANNKNMHEGKKRYIVRLVDDSVPSYKGDVLGLEKTNIATLKNGLGNIKFNAKSNASLKYADYLETKQQSFVTKASSILSTKVANLQSFKFAINGLVTELTFEQAKKLSLMAEVAFIERDKLIPLNTDTGPILIGADKVWDGSASDTGSEFLGEGIIIGVIDTGINTDHRSFAATGDDGYTVVNPFGDGNYVGDCVATSSLCNSKLIGVRSYSAVTDVYADPIFAGDTRPANGEDYNGHGSHTASTAGGNVLNNVPYTITDITAENPDDGVETTFIFNTMSGVAPHANIIAYQTCLPGDSGDTYAGCYSASGIGAIDDAISDGVDVINYSIGGTTNFSPWNSATELGFLSANAAGIYVATSAGNSGPAPVTNTKVSPWYTAVAAVNHGNSTVIADGNGKSIGSFTGGDTAPPADLNGGGTNASFSGDLVYAGDFVNPNDPSGDPAQCLQPFPAATFTAAQIVVCDRGAIARVQKAANAAAGGAGGFVLANIQGGSDTVSDDFYSIPGIHIDATDGDTLKLWMSSGAGHIGSISAGGFIRSTNTADQLASFSSRGPNEFADVITPEIAAPGVTIYAAYSDDQPFMDVNGGVPSDFAFLSGTSMASPHVAGSAALVMQAQPTWNVDQVRSALMMTATTAVLKEDGATDADAFDIGAGRVRVDLAINAGLVMSETAINYQNADPALGGDPKSLNVPSMANLSCAASCSWTRTFTAVKDGTYNLSSESDVMTMEPSSFTAVAGESFNVVFSLDVTATSTGSSVFDEVVITSSGQPDLHLPVAAVVNNGAVPEDFVMTVGRDNGSWAVDGVQTIPTDDLNFIIDGLYDNNATGLVEVLNFDIVEDPTVGDLFDSEEGIFSYEVTVPANTVSLKTAITEATSPDNDLYIFMDSTGDGIYDSFVAAQADFETNESVTVEEPVAGDYLVLVQNYSASSPGASDTGLLTVEVVPLTDPVEGLSVNAPTSADGFVDMQLLWDKKMMPGDSFHAEVTALAGTVVLGTFAIDLNRTVDDFSSVANQTLVTRGDQIEYTLSVEPNLYNQSSSYSVSVDIPAGMTLVEGSVVASGGDVTIKDPNAVGLELVSEFSIAEDPIKDDPTDPVDVNYDYPFEVPTGQLSLRIAISDSTSPDNDLWLLYDTVGDGTGWTIIAAERTAATDEIMTVAAPEAGMYRAIVQNYDDSVDGGLDTGTLSITTVPATGEGFIWGLDVGAFLPEYTVVSAANSGTCAAAGLGGFAGTGGYAPLSAFGIGTIGISGDETTISAFGDSTFNFFGEEKLGLQISDNGFVMFSGTAGDSAWDNTPLPTPSIPNDIIAGLWKDQIIEDDGLRGIRLAGLGPVTIIDFDGLEPWTPSGDSTERYYYQVQVMSDGVSNDHSGFGPFEIIISWADTQGGSLGGATVGVENSDGTKGFDVSDKLEAGGQLCLDYNTPPSAFEITYTVVPTAEYRGEYATMDATVTSSLNGTEDFVLQGALVDLVNVAPTADAGPDTTYDRASTDEATLNGAASIDLDVDRLSYQWTQTGGIDVGLRGSNAQQAYFNLSDVPNGSYTFSLTVKDASLSSTDDITITVVGKSNESKGVGSMGMLILLIAGTLFGRRRYRR